MWSHAYAEPENKRTKTRLVDAERRVAVASGGGFAVGETGERDQKAQSSSL